MTEVETQAETTRAEAQAQPAQGQAYPAGRTFGRFPYTYRSGKHWRVFDPDGTDRDTGAPTGRTYTVEQWCAERGETLPALVGGEAIIRGTCGGCGRWPEVLRRMRGTMDQWRCDTCYPLGE